MGGSYASEQGTDTLTYQAIVTVEELLEMLGIATFIHALLSYITDSLQEVVFQLRLCQEQPGFQLGMSKQRVPESTYEQRVLPERD